MALKIVACAALYVLAVVSLEPISCVAQVGTDVSAGEALYAADCAGCHGDKLHNNSGGVTFNLRLLKPTDRERFASSVNNGKGQMPPWRGVLTEDEIAQIWAYILANNG